MAWIVVSLEGTLIQDTQEGPLPVPGAVEAMLRLASEGHRLTVFTSELAPMPQSEKQRLREMIEHDIVGLGFPPMEVWTGTTKPEADLFIGDNYITFDGDWGLVLAQTQVMMQDRGLLPQMGGFDQNWGADYGDESAYQPQADGEETKPAPSKEKPKKESKDKKEKK